VSRVQGRSDAARPPRPAGGRRGRCAFRGPARELGGWVAVLAGLQAEDAIQHGEAIHELMEQHERQALVTMGIFTVVLVWKLNRRFNVPRIEELVLRGLGVLGFIGLLYTTAAGGKLAFEHAAGVP